jgi:hypothetical protein
VKGVERRPPIVAPAHAAIDPGQERCEPAVETDVALAAPREHAATPALTRDKRVALTDVIPDDRRRGSKPGRTGFQVRVILEGFCYTRVSRVQLIQLETGTASRS